MKVLKSFLEFVIEITAIPFILGIFAAALAGIVLPLITIVKTIKDGHFNFNKTHSELLETISNKLGEFMSKAKRKIEKSGSGCNSSLNS